MSKAETFTVVTRIEIFIKLLSSTIADHVIDQKHLYRHKCLVNLVMLNPLQNNRFDGANQVKRLNNASGLCSQSFITKLTSVFSVISGHELLAASYSLDTRTL